MRYRLRAEIDGLLHLPGPSETFTAEKDGNIFFLESGPDRRTTHLSVSIPIPVERAGHHAAMLSVNQDGSERSAMTLAVDPEIHERCESLLQEFESVFSVCSGVPTLSRIRWHEAQSSLIPENDEERTRVQFWDLSVTTNSVLRPARLDATAFQAHVNKMGRYGYLVVLMSFYHEGNNRRDAGAHLQAFHAFYFVFEGLFGDGRSSKPELLKAFLADATCVEVTEKALETFAAMSAKPVVRFRSLMAQHGYEWRVDGLLAFIIDMRGRLHHMPSKPARDGMQPNMFKPDNAEALSVVVAYVSHLGLLRRVVPIDRRHAGLT